MFDQALNCKDRLSVKEACSTVEENPLLLQGIAVPYSKA